MPRMRVLNSTEQASYDNPPVFDSRERHKYFDLTVGLERTASHLKTPTNRVGFILSFGYFRATKRFFSPRDFRSQDIEHVARQIDVDVCSFQPQAYANRTRQRHEALIAEALAVVRYDADAELLIKGEIGDMVRAQLKPKLIFWRCIDLLHRRRIELPSYYRLADLIVDSLNQRKRDLAKVIDSELSSSTRELLDDLFVRADSMSSPDSSPNTRYQLTLLKSFSQSTRPAKIRERVIDHRYLRDLHEQLLPLLGVLDLGHGGVRYFANSVIKADIFQLSQRTDEDRYVHAVAFVAHQYYQLQDNLVETLLNVVPSTQNAVQREHMERCYTERQHRDDNLTGLVTRLDTNVFALVRRIRACVETSGLPFDGHKASCPTIWLDDGMSDNMIVGWKSGQAKPNYMRPLGMRVSQPSNNHWTRSSMR